MTQQKMIGREAELEVLAATLTSPEAEMVSVIGRRRVGKTFLIKHAFEGKIAFQLSGIQDGTIQEQLRAFTNQMRVAAPEVVFSSPPKDWLDAFFVLAAWLDTKVGDEKIVVFFDEVPWLAANRSGFLKALGYFWNTWAEQKNVVVVICGSAASWMIQKVLRDKGGLHNRVTKRIRLKPFNLHETEAYLRSRGLDLERDHILQLYMVMGGIPHYLKEIQGQMSAAQYIDQICFRDGGLLKDEFQNLYDALFFQADLHKQLVRVLSEKHYGMLRSELVKSLTVTDSGRVTQVLEELVESGFVTEYVQFGKVKKEKIYRLTDAYSGFYLRFIEPNQHETKGIWEQLSQTASARAWSGYAFENICFSHAAQVKDALGISGIFSTVSAFHRRATTDHGGIQIDMLIDRSDRVINLIEIKFLNEMWAIDKPILERIREKTALFKSLTLTRKMVHWVAISTFGVLRNAQSTAAFAKTLSADVLFVAER